MRLRPCIDIHNGAVKQIIGSTLSDAADSASENFVADKDAAYYASLFREDDLPGGHVIGLNARTSPFFEATKRQMLSALAAYPGGLMAGGGIRPENAEEYLCAGASHVIVTSYVFFDGQISYPRLEEMVSAVGREHLCLDLSCRRTIPEARTSMSADPGTDASVRSAYYVATDRWQKLTSVQVTPQLLKEMSAFCGEILVHAVNAEGKQAGVDRQLLAILAESPVPITYAGGVGKMEDLEEIRRIGKDRVDVTIGSALSVYGGKLPYEDVVRYFRETGAAL